MVNSIVKRDGRIVKFDTDKIALAILEAAKSVYDINNNTDKDYDSLAHKYAREVRWHINNEYSNDNLPTVENVQDLVEKILISHKEDKIAKEYILYRHNRTMSRDMNNKIITTIRDIVHTDSNDLDIKRENANIDGDTSMGSMLEIGSNTSKQFYEMYMLRPDIAEAHMNGDIHIHDLDFYALTTTCTQIDIGKLFKDGFSTGHGYIREPSNIITAAALACIAIQSNQNDQHGGQSIPNFEYALAPYVAKSFVKNIIKYLDMNDTTENSIKQIKDRLESYLHEHTLILNEDGIEYTKNILHDIVGLDYNIIKKCIDKAIRYTKKDTHQAMEALVHNLNSMHSRAGAQVPFSSINFGTGTKEEERIVIENLLIATNEGLGNGETPIFPISIFKVKEGINYNPEDPNYDLFKLACKVSAKRLFPNFSFLDSPYNLRYYKSGHPETECSYMGCRTRVIGNVYDPSREIVSGRGNLSFTSINLPRLAIKTQLEYNGNSNATLNDKIEYFMSILDNEINLVFDQLYDRFKVQCSRKVKNYPFLMGQGVWIDSDKLNPNDTLEEVLKHGTLTVGFIGLAECLKELTGKHHGESEESQELGLKIIQHMRDRCDDKSNETKLNFTLIATPAEGLSGRFVRIDKKKYGVIEGVTDRDYYTNSFHIPVYYNISAFDKIRLEAPYHAMTNAGHITYIELDGDPLKNLEAFEDIVRCAHDYEIGYFAINHPVDECGVCGYVGIIDNECPRCGRKDGEGVPVSKLIELKKKYPSIIIPE